MIINNPQNSFLTLCRLLFSTEEFYTDAFTEWVEVLVEEDFFHLLVYGGQLITQDGFHDKLVGFGWDVEFWVLDHMGEDLTEGDVDFLSMDGDGIDEKGDDLLIFWFIITA